MYGNPSYSFQENKQIIEASIKFIWSSERFAGSLMWLTASSESYI